MPQLSKILTMHGELESAGFARRVMHWQKMHGRHDLPWQGSCDPYPVWLSEIMLQQTQVTTVLNYFPRFLQRLPDLPSLAAAELDEVLALWSGLGYYSRARNLHRCAIAVMQWHGGRFPASAAQLQRLPGIGRSTAAAISSLCFGERVAILDGNVKRLLTRALGFGADLSIATNEAALWELAAKLLPKYDLKKNMPRYTQAVMDLGAGICSASKPQCAVCPLGALCRARQQGRCEHYPVKSRRLQRGTQTIWLLWAQRQDQSVWLLQRPNVGIWAGLYSFAGFDSRDALLAHVPVSLRAGAHDAPAFKHALTHKDLLLHPVQVPWRSNVGLPGPGSWIAADDWPGLGLPAPIRKLLAGGNVAMPN